jgi:hypothetical protein
MTISEEQETFLQVLDASLGVVGLALQKTGIDMDTYEDWLKNIFFSKRVQQINETSVDYVENQLIRLIQDGNISAITFYLKTKGKERGY